MCQQDLFVSRTLPTQRFTIKHLQSLQHYNNRHNTYLRKSVSVILKCDINKEECSSLKVILGLKHFGAFLNVLMHKFCVCALVGVLIK